MENFQKTAIEIGAGMIENGAEISRAEDTVERILASQGVQDINVFCLNSVIIVSSSAGCEIRRIRRNDLNLAEIDKLNTMSRSICQSIRYEDKKCRYSPLTMILSIFLATGSFCIYFGGTYTDAAIAGITGLIISYMPSVTRSIFPKTLIDATVAGLLSYIPSLFGIICNPDKIMIGTIMLLIPGLTVGNAMRDIMYSDTLSGIIELTESVFLAVAIAIGYSVAVMIFGYD